MATGKLSWTPELVSRVHSALGFLVASSVLLMISVLPMILDGDGFFILPLAGFGCLFVGLLRLRGITGDALRVSSGAVMPKAASQDVQWEAPPVTATPVFKQSTARSSIEPPVASYGRTSPAKKAVTTAPAGPAFEWEEWVGQKLLQKVGIVIVLIGMLVLLQQAFENRWIDELGRVFLAFLGSALLLGAGEWFQKKYAQWAHGFTGGGLVLAYLGVWVAHVLYPAELQSSYSFSVPASVAFFLYGAITAVGVLLSVRYKAQTVAWFAIAGGYLTPFLVDASAANPIALAAYLGILAAGLLTLSAFRRWAGISTVAFVATQFYLFTGVYADVALSDASQIFVAILFFVLFAALPLVRNFGQQLKAEPEDLFLIVANAVAVFFPVQNALGGWQSEWITLVFLMLAGFCIAFAAAALQLRRDDRVLGDTYLLGSVVMIALALYHQLGWEWLAIGWAPYAVVVAALAVALKRKSIWGAAHLLLIGAVAAQVTQMPVFDVAREASWQPFLSNWSIQSYVLFASLLALLPIARKAPQELTQGAPITTALHLLIAFLVFGVITFEVTGLQWNTSVPLAVSYLVYAALAVAVFVATRSLVWFGTAMVMQFLVFIFVFARGDGAGMDALSLLDIPRQAAYPLAHPWAFVSVLATLSLAGLLLAVQRTAEHPLLPKVRVRTLILGMIVAQVWLHVSVEVQHAAAWFDWSIDAYNRVLSAWWLIVAVVVAGFAKNNTNWNRAAILLFALPFLKDTFRLIDGDTTLFDTIAWTLIALGVAVYGAKSQKREWQIAGIAALGVTAAADMIVNAAESDAGILRSVWWAIAGLLSMVSGFALKAKLLRQTAIGIFAATVLKLLLVDFSVLETPVRIVASIATGLLLIGASYLYQRFGASQSDR